MPPNNFLCKHVGSLLVTLQLAFIALLAVPAAPAFVKLRAPAPAWALAMLGVLIGWWALRHNRPGNFNIRPLPHARGHLINDGPYRWIRIGNSTA